MAEKRMWRVAAHARAGTTRDGLALLDVKRGKVVTSNAVGARIWTLVDEGCDLTAILSVISAETGTSKDVIRQDITGFLRDLEQCGLIEPQEQAPEGGKGT
ncbi:MAG: PqqD family peptide modification chaperone [Luteitalea sp.]|nr:PqqD family peptide modification chaperone [Luteitalea sp.]